jgi:hypothetical protein
MTLEFSFIVHFNPISNSVDAKAYIADYVEGMTEFYKTEFPDLQVTQERLDTWENDAKMRLKYKYQSEILRNQRQAVQAISELHAAACEAIQKLYENV